MMEHCFNLLLVFALLYFNYYYSYYYVDQVTGKANSRRVPEVAASIPNPTHNQALTMETKTD